MTSNTPIATAYSELIADIGACATECGRSEHDVTLLAVSKTRTASEVAAAYHAGARHFGENYLQDALPKIHGFSAQRSSGEQVSKDDYSELCWHFIGALQSNKTNDVANHFSWVHTIDRVKIARRLNQARPDELAPLNVCLQVNLHNEPQKAGISPEQLPELLDLMTELPRLAVRGLMIIPATNAEPAAAFDALAALFNRLTPADAARARLWDTQSMGMSGDYRAAIAAGSTMVRIGTALFGPRQT